MSLRVVAYSNADVLDSYVAGFFDGEGTIDIHRQSRYGISLNHRLRASLSNSYLPILKTLQAEYGGNISKEHKDVEKDRKTVYQWALTSTYAASFLKRIRPYLKEKEPQAWLALEFLAQRSVSRGVQLIEEEVALREGFYWALRNAKRL